MAQLINDFNKVIEELNELKKCDSYLKPYKLDDTSWGFIHNGLKHIYEKKKNHRSSRHYDDDYKSFESCFKKLDNIPIRVRQDLHFSVLYRMRHIKFFLCEMYGSVYFHRNSNNMLFCINDWKSEFDKVIETINELSDKNPNPLLITSYKYISDDDITEYDEDNIVDFEDKRYIEQDIIIEDQWLFIHACLRQAKFKYTYTEYKEDNGKSHGECYPLCVRYDNMTNFYNGNNGDYNKWFAGTINDDEPQIDEYYDLLRVTNYPITTFELNSFAKLHKLPSETIFDFYKFRTYHDYGIGVKYDSDSDFDDDNDYSDDDNSDEEICDFESKYNLKKKYYKNCKYNIEHVKNLEKQIKQKLVYIDEEFMTKVNTPMNTKILFKQFTKQKIRNNTYIVRKICSFISY